jgi:leucyl-tRNA synthetase
LESATDWVNVDCPICGQPAKRETDTMDGFACSSWYFLRFADPHNQKKAFDPEVAKKWLPVDDYIGGAEHAVMHLLYARFWTKVMYDAGIIDFQEPFSTLRNHGMILAPDGLKMSKSKGNTIEPDEIISQGYGAAQDEIMELFIGPWNQSANWSVKGMGGCYRFLQRVWTLTQEHIEARGKETHKEQSDDLLKLSHTTIKKVSSDMHQLGFNTAIASLMEFVNDLYKHKVNSPLGTKAWDDALLVLIKLIAPFAPHIAEELWHDMGNEGSVHVNSWPVHDEKYLTLEEITIVVQVNGRVRANILMPADADQDTIVAAAKADTKVQPYLVKDVRKTVYIPKKLVNFVV